MIGIIGCATIEDVLLMSAWQIMSSWQIAGLKQQVKMADRDIAYFYSARSIGVENANDAGEVACNKPEAQAKGIE